MKTTSSIQKTGVRSQSGDSIGAHPPSLGSYGGRANRGLDSVWEMECRSGGVVGGDDFNHERHEPCERIS